MGLTACREPQCLYKGALLPYLNSNHITHDFSPILRISYTYFPIPVFLNRRAAARYQALASIIPGLERFSWKLSF
jgi:hypothetical protein